MSADSVTERTRAFYDWEIRQRSWERFSYAVDLEPPLAAPRPIQPARGIDDGRKETWLSSLLGDTPEPESAAPEVQPPLPRAASPLPPFESVSLTVPEDLEVTPRASEAWLRTLETSRHRIAWEIVFRRGVASFQLSASPVDRSLAEASLASVFPDVLRTPVRASLDDWWSDSEGQHVLGLELGLGSEFVVPLEELRDFKLDPLSQIIPGLALAGAEGLGIFQVLFRHVDSRWPAAIKQAVTTRSGQPFFADAPEITNLAGDKVASPLLAVAVRLVVRAVREAACWGVARAVAGGLALLKSPGNELIPVSMEQSGRVVLDVLSRSTHRHGMLLSTRELAGLVHLPNATVHSEKLLRLNKSSRASPESARGGGVLLGVNKHHGRNREVRLSIEDRLRHCHVVGASGTGKSTLLVSMMLDDIEQGCGVAVLDPHGDLVDELLARIPRKRRNDVVLFDPADPDYVVGWNILGASSELEKELLASDLAAAFERHATSWGDQMTTVLSNAILAFLSSDGGGTLLELRRFLLESAYRKAFLDSVSDEYIASYWRNDFPLIAKRNPQAPILTRLNTFLRNRLVREVVTQRRGLIDFRSVLDEGRIFLGRLSQGAIGEENASLLGSLLVSKIHQVTLSRQDVAREEREPFFLYLDEFHEIATPSMARMFSGVCKYGLALTIAHQDLFQLRQTLPAVERAVLANAHTRICFRVGDEDAKRLADGFSSFDAAALLDLDVGEAIVRVGKRTGDFNLQTSDIPRVDREVGQDLRQHALRRWGVPRGEVDVPQSALSRGRADTPESPSTPTEDTVPIEKKVTPPPNLDKALLDFLEHVACFPLSGVRERNAALGLSAASGQRLKAALLEEELVREVVVNPGSRGGQFKLLELLSIGRDILERLGVHPATGLGRGGVAHRWWVSKIAEWLAENGLKPRIEDESSGVRVDLSYRVGNRKIAVEVETSRGHILENISKDLGAGFDSVVTLVDEALDLEEIEAKLRSDLEDQMRSVRLGLLPDFRKRLAISTSARRLAPPNKNKEPRRANRRRRVASATSDSMHYLPQPGVLTTPAAAEYLGLSPATLNSMRSRGGGPAFSKLGRRVVYRREDLDTWVLERQQRSTSDS